jgi:flagellar biosynthetic protein FliQ
VTTGAVLMLAREMLVMSLLLVSPFLGIAVLATFVMGLLQETTRMNDLTLSFVPRFVAVMLMVYFAASWAASHMTGYIERSAVLARTLIE